ncbi:hypothetical protein THIOKS12100009 [Thiocapsa sp. KS1]|nr:hypothetical protein THIOKS12100009 [Thiocapsa sp. KS1]
MAGLRVRTQTTLERFCPSTVAGDLGTNQRRDRFNGCWYTNVQIVHRGGDERNDWRVGKSNVFGIELVEALVVRTKSVGLELSERLQVLPIERPGSDEVGREEPLSAFVGLRLQPVAEQKGADRVKRGVIEVGDALAMDADLTIRAEAAQLVEQQPKLIGHCN